MKVSNCPDAIVIRPDPPVHHSRWHEDYGGWGQRTSFGIRFQKADAERKVHREERMRMLQDARTHWNGRFLPSGKSRQKVS